MWISVIDLCSYISFTVRFASFVNTTCIFQAYDCDYWRPVVRLDKISFYSMPCKLWKVAEKTGIAPSLKWRLYSSVWSNRTFSESMFFTCINIDFFFKILWWLDFWMTGFVSICDIMYKIRFIKYLYLYTYKHVFITCILYLLFRILYISLIQLIIDIFQTYSSIFLNTLQIKIYNK